MSSGRLDNTYTWIKKQVEELASERSIQTDRAFAVWSMEYVYLSMDTDEALMQTDTLRGNGGGDGGLDGWYRDDNSKEFHLWQFKWTDSYNKKFDQKPTIELKEALSELLDIDSASQYGLKFLEVATELKYCLDYEYKIVLNVGIAGFMSDTAKQQSQRKINNFAQDKKLAISWELWDLERFQQEYEEHHPVTATLEGITENFLLQSSSIIYMDSDDSTLPPEWEVVVASLNGRCLGEIATKLNSKLFSLNVRFALNSNKRIKSIRDSLAEPEKARYFWLYNNGLTILCDNFEIQKDDNNQPNKISITNPQVVNGCQTVTAFRKQLGKYSEQASVLARIIKAPSDDKGKEQAKQIAEKTNSQNPVLSRDLRSNDSVQEKLRISFEQLEPSWFYERKRGEWNTLKNVQKDKFKQTDISGKTFYRRFDMEYVGQSWRMLDGYPSRSITKKRELFEDERIYKSVFNPNRSPEQYLFAAILRKKYEEFWHGNNFEGIRKAGGKYLDDIVLKRILHAKGQVVAHSVALTCRAIKSGKTWSLKDAKLGLQLIDDFDIKWKTWNGLLAKSFHELIRQIDSDEESPGLKSILEKSSDNETLEQLWSSIDSSASGMLSLLNLEEKTVQDILLGNLT